MDGVPNQDTHPLTKAFTTDSANLCHWDGLCPACESVNASKDVHKTPGWWQWAHDINVETKGRYCVSLHLGALACLAGLCPDTLVSPHGGETSVECDTKARVSGLWSVKTQNSRPCV